MFGTKSLKNLIAAGALALSAGAASAVTTCQFGDASEFTLTLTADVYTTTACVGQLSGMTRQAHEWGIAYRYLWHQQLGLG